MTVNSMNIPLLSGKVENIFMAYQKVRSSSIAVWEFISKYGALSQKNLGN